MKLGNTLRYEKNEVINSIRTKTWYLTNGYVKDFIKYEINHTVQHIVDEETRFSVYTPLTNSVIDSINKKIKNKWI